MRRAYVCGAVEQVLIGTSKGKGTTEGATLVLVVRSKGAHTGISGIEVWC